MNRFHRWYCASGHWANTLQRRLLPWALADCDLGDHVLELGPGPGLATRVLSGQASRFTVVELDPQLARPLREIRAEIDVLVADATALPFADGRFSAVVSFTMLHHVPSADLQDHVFAEARRVLRPGGVFVGSDSTTGPLFRLAHVRDTMVLVPPAGLPARLERAGLVDPHVEQGRHAFRFRARREGAA